MTTRELRHALRLMFAAALLALGALGQAWADPPGRVGRLAQASGTVWIYDQEQGEWTAVAVNRPITTGDRVATDDNARADIQIGSASLRLDGGSELAVDQLDDQRVSLRLERGSAALRLRSAESVDEFELLANDARFQPTRTGQYRLDVRDHVATAQAWSGEMRFQSQDSTLLLQPGTRYSFWRQDDRTHYDMTTTSGEDAFGAWVLAQDQRENVGASTRYVSPEMTGALDLDRHGRWDTHPEYGAIWYPTTVVAGWAPYRYGHWAWVAPWGWSWVDDAPWGFAPFHYGRWAYWGNRWCWVPGRYVARPVYAPALVGWIGGNHLSVGIVAGRRPPPPLIGWVPLAPRDHYVPRFNATPRYIRNINAGHARWQPPPGSPQPWVNRNAPGAVTVVTTDAMRDRRRIADRVVQRVEPRWNAAVAVQQPQLPPPPARQGRADDRRDRDDRPDRPDVQDRQDRPARPDRPDRPNPADRPDRDRQDRPDRPNGGDRDDRPARPDRPDRPGAPSAGLVPPPPNVARPGGQPPDGGRVPPGGQPPQQAGGAPGQNRPPQGWPGQQPGARGPQEPGQQGQGGQPGQPGQAGLPGRQGQPDQPGQPGQVGQPGQQGQPGQPGQWSNRPDGQRPVPPPVTVTTQPGVPPPQAPGTVSTRPGVPPPPPVPGATQPPGQVNFPGQAGRPPASPAAPQPGVIPPPPRGGAQGVGPAGQGGRDGDGDRTPPLRRSDGYQAGGDSMPGAPPRVGRDQIPPQQRGHGDAPRFDNPRPAMPTIPGDQVPPPAPRGPSGFDNPRPAMPTIPGNRVPPEPPRGGPAGFDNPRPVMPTVPPPGNRLPQEGPRGQSGFEDNRHGFGARMPGEPPRAPQAAVPMQPPAPMAPPQAVVPRPAPALERPPVPQMPQAPQVVPRPQAPPVQSMPQAPQMQPRPMAPQVQPMPQAQPVQPMPRMPQARPEAPMPQAVQPRAAPVQMAPPMQGGPAQMGQGSGGRPFGGPGHPGDRGDRRGPEGGGPRER